MNNNIKKEIKEKKRQIKKEKLSFAGINLKNALKVPLLLAPALFCSSGVYLAARQKEYNPLSIYDSGLHTTIETSIDENIEEKRINSPYENEENHKESNFKSVITEYSGYHKLEDGYYMRTINEYELESDPSNIYEMINRIKNYNSDPEKERYMGTLVNSYSEIKKELDETDRLENHYKATIYSKGEKIKEDFFESAMEMLLFILLEFIELSAGVIIASSVDFDSTHSVKDKIYDLKKELKKLKTQEKIDESIKKSLLLKKNNNI